MVPSQIELLARDDAPGLRRSWGSMADSLRTGDGLTVSEGDQIRFDGRPSPAVFDGTVECVLRPFNPSGPDGNSDWVLQVKNGLDKRFLLIPGRSGGKLQVVAHAK